MENEDIQNLFSINLPQQALDEQKNDNLEFSSAEDAMKWLEDKHSLILESHFGTVTSVSITQDSKHIVSGGVDNTLRIWNLQEKFQEAVLRGHTGTVSSIAVTQNKQIHSVRI